MSHKERKEEYKTVDIVFLRRAYGFDFGILLLSSSRWGGESRRKAQCSGATKQPCLVLWHPESLEGKYALELPPSVGNIINLLFWKIFFSFLKQLTSKRFAKLGFVCQISSSWIFRSRFQMSIITNVLLLVRRLGWRWGGGACSNQRLIFLLCQHLANS